MNTDHKFTYSKDNTTAKAVDIGDWWTSSDWHHYTVTFDASFNARLYFDASLVLLKTHS